MREVAKNLGVSIDAVTYFMRKYELKRRSFTEISQILFSKKPISFRLKKNLNQSDEILKVLGVTLYWGEGYKSKKAKGVDFANSDPNMIKVFVNFLRKICDIDESRLRVYLYCYANQNPRKLLDFWSKVTKISPTKFTKPYVRRDFRKEKIDKMKNGLIHVRYCDKKLLIQILNWIEEYKNKYAPIV
ncbi:MAG: hypothetical protein AAB861_00440 [Patescibacteria group bacterium]